MSCAAWIALRWLQRLSTAPGTRCALAHKHLLAPRIYLELGRRRTACRDAQDTGGCNGQEVLGRQAFPRLKLHGATCNAIHQRQQRRGFQVLGYTSSSWLWAEQQQRGTCWAACSVAACGSRGIGAVSTKSERTPVTNRCAHMRAPSQRSPSPVPTTLPVQYIEKSMFMPDAVSMHHSGNEQWALRELERRASLHQQQEQHALLQLQHQQQDLLRQQQHVQAMHQQQQQLQTIHERLLLREQLLASLAGNSDRLKQLDAAPSDGQRVAAEGLWHHKQADVANRPAPPLLPDMFQPKKLVGGVCYS